MLLTLTFALYYIYVFSIFLVQEAEAADFNDLGKMLLGGFALAIVAAVLFVLVKLRLRARKPSTAEFLSISNVSEKR